jgi:hypothetical protein
MLDDRDSIPGSIKDISLHHSNQSEAGTHPVFYTMSTGGSFPVGKAAGA